MELAVVLPAVVGLLFVLLAAGSAVLTQARVTDAARAGARAAVAGETIATVNGIVRELAGADATVAVGIEGEMVSVAVSAPVPPRAWGLHAHGAARVPVEPTGAPRG